MQTVNEEAPEKKVRPRRMTKKKRESRRKVIKALLLLSAVCLAVFVARLLVFRLTTVYVIGNEDKTPQQIVTSAGLYKGMDLLSLTEKEVSETIAKDHTLIFQGMQKEYPGTLYLYVKERKTAAAMQWLGMLYTLDDEGMVMTVENNATVPNDLPVVTGFQAGTVHVGQKLVVHKPEQLAAYTKIVDELTSQQYVHQIKEINLATPANMYLVTLEGVTVRLGDISYMHAKIGSVRLGMTKLRQFGEIGGVLDVTIPESPVYIPEH